MGRLTLSVIALIILCGFGDTAYFANERGNKLYKEGRYEDALKEYGQAGVGPTPPKEVEYNRGNALFRLGRYNEAAKAYAKAFQTAKPGLKKNSGYNMGTAFYKAGEKAYEAKKLEDASKLFKESVKRLKASLKDDPSDNDARHNLELALKKLEDTEQQKKESQKDKPDEQKKDQKEEKPKPGKDGEKEQKESGQTGDDEQDKKEDEASQQSDKGEDEKDKEQLAPGEQSQITPEQAKQIFNAIEQDERALRNKMRGESAKERRKTDKDW